MCRLMVYLSSLNFGRLLLWKLPVLCLCFVMRSMKIVAAKATAIYASRQLSIRYGSGVWLPIRPSSYVATALVRNSQTGVRKQFNSGNAFWVRQRCLHGNSKSSTRWHVTVFTVTCYCVYRKLALFVSLHSLNRTPRIWSSVLKFYLT